MPTGQVPHIYSEAYMRETRICLRKQLCLSLIGVAIMLGRFTWLNSNMPDLALGNEESKHVMPHTFVPLGHNRSVLLCGLLSD